MATSEIVDTLVASLEEAYRLPAWHGPNLRQSISRVQPIEAAWRPSPGQYSIWEYVIHSAYWKYAVRRRLAGARRGSFARDGSNWFHVEAAGRTDAELRRAWSSDRRLLDDEHNQLLATVADVPAQAWSDASKRGPRFLVSGVAAHDVYHAGQIQLLRRLYAASHVSPPR